MLQEIINAPEFRNYPVTDFSERKNREEMQKALDINLKKFGTFYCDLHIDDKWIRTKNLMNQEIHLTFLNY